MNIISGCVSDDADYWFFNKQVCQDRVRIAGIVVNIRLFNALSDKHQQVKNNACIAVLTYYASQPNLF
jgi:hypothetical protein